MLKDFIESNVSRIDDEDWEFLLENCPQNLLGALIQVLSKVGVDPKRLKMDTSPEGCAVHDFIYDIADEEQFFFYTLVVRNVNYTTAADSFWYTYHVYIDGMELQDEGEHETEELDDYSIGRYIARTIILKAVEESNEGRY